MKPMKRFATFSLFFWLLLAACSNAPAAATATPSPVLIATATLRPTATPFRTATPPAATSTATVAPVTGQATAPVNVRPRPSLIGEPLGLLAAGESVQVIGQNASGNWYRILYPSAADGTGWVAADFINIINPKDVPIVATPPAAEPPGNIGAVVQQLNVREGPGVDYDVLGILPPGANITLLGITDDGQWLQISYEESPTGIGWVYAPYVQTSAADLPVFVPGEDENAPPLPATATPTPQPAADDGDSASQPLTGVTFDANIRTFTFTDQISAPLGDPQDTIQFAIASSATTTTPLLIRVECSGGAPEILISPLPLADPIACNRPFRAVDVLPGRAYLLTLRLTAEEMTVVDYTLYLSLP
jgi:uncharacterized protein YraI